MSHLPISVCIPVKNEERNLQHCLDSLQAAFDEIVVVDSGSTDSTRQIAEASTAVVIDFRWNGHFPKKRNWALRNYNFKHPWVLFLDADERLTPAVVEELRKVIPSTTHVGFWLSFTNWFMGHPIKHGDIFRKLALFRKEAGQYEEFPEHWWSKLDMEVHEHPVLCGTVGVLRPALEHHDYRGLASYLNKHNEYSTWEANRYLWLKSADAGAWAALTSRQRFKYKYLAQWWLPWLYFAISYIIRGGFLDGSTGWNFARIKMRYFDEIRLKIQEKQNASI